MIITIKDTVAKNQTSIIEQKEIRSLDFLFSFLGTAGLKETKSFKDTSNISARQDKI